MNWLKWNKIRYSIYAPFYDLIGNIFNDSRKRSIDNLDIKNGDKVLLLGAGTGIDLAFLPENCTVYATDITEAMVKRIRKKALGIKVDVKPLVMDGQNLEFPDEHFDKVILHLILAVIPDPHACIKEVDRVTKTGGGIAVFDKFLTGSNPPGVTRRFLNRVTRLLFSDINRRIENIIAPTDLKLIHNKPEKFGGTFRLILLRK